jgi:hypothetical protein
MMPKEHYGRTATRDVRSAAALALRDHLATLTFVNGGAPFCFAEVFEEWPAYLDRYVPPSACVLPGAWKYGDSNFTPTLLEDTWEPEGESGWGLYKTAELEVDFEVVVGATSPSEREAIVLGVEDAFQAPGLLMDEAQGPRNAIILPLSAYYGLSARFALLSARVIDSEEQAMRERREAIFTIQVQAPKVKLGPVHPLALKLVINST